MFRPCELTALVGRYHAGFAVGAAVALTAAVIGVSLLRTGQAPALEQHEPAPRLRRSSQEA
jgi:hypothetical protein